MKSPNDCEATEVSNIVVTNKSAIGDTSENEQNAEVANNNEIGSSPSETETSITARMDILEDREMGQCSTNIMNQNKSTVADSSRNSHKKRKMAKDSTNMMNEYESAAANTCGIIILTPDKFYDSMCAISFVF